MKKRLLVFIVLLLFNFGSVLPILNVYAVSSITYDSGTNTITVLGYPQNNPVSIWDMWNASNVNGWNVIHNNRENNSQFQIDAKIILGDGVFGNRAFWNDTDVQLFFIDSIINGTWQFTITVKHYSGIKWGILEDATQRRTSSGLHVIENRTYGVGGFIYTWTLAYLEIYSTSITNIGTAEVWTIYAPNENINYPKKIFNSVFSGKNNFRFAQPNSGEIFNLMLQQGKTGFGQDSMSSYLTRIYITDYQDLVGMGGTQSASITEVYARGITYIAWVNFDWVGDYLNLTDADTDTWNIFWHPTGGATGQIYRKYTFKINVTDIEGVPIENANVTMIDLDGIEEFSVLTGANGSFNEQIVTYGFYNETGGNIAYKKTPHNLTITHENYTTLSYTVTIDEWKTVVQVVLESAEASYGLGLGSGFILAFILSIAFLAIVIMKRR